MFISNKYKNNKITYNIVFYKNKTMKLIKKV